jgi:hypothetical protein
MANKIKYKTDEERKKAHNEAVKRYKQKKRKSIHNTKDTVSTNKVTVSDYIFFMGIILGFLCDLFIIWRLM